MPRRTSIAGGASIPGLVATFLALALLLSGHPGTCQEEGGAAGSATDAGAPGAEATAEAGAGEVAASPQVAEAAQGETAAKDEPSPMERLFARKCASCHTIGEGPRVGPDLKGVTDQQPRDWIVRLIREPSRMLDTDQRLRKLVQEFKGVRMPDLGLTESQVQGLADLIARCSVEPCDLTPELRPVTLATAEDKEMGRMLFLGHESLTNGGPSCVSCHTVRGAGGFLPGGTLAKDLTHAFARLGDAGLDAALANPSFPLMMQIFGERPLEPGEVFALRAFLYEANRSEPEPQNHWSMASMGLLGAVLVLLILNAFWRRRLRGVRRTIAPHHE